MRNYRRAEITPDKQGRGWALRVADVWGYLRSRCGRGSGGFRSRAAGMVGMDAVNMVVLTAACDSVSAT
jgi:hypothetical protein